MTLQETTRERLARARALRGVAPSERIPIAASYLASRVDSIFHTARRRAQTGQVKLVEYGSGPFRANRFFWSSPTTKPTWFDTQRRLEHLAASHPDAVDDFVLLGLRRTADATTLIGFAQHPLSTDTIREWLESANRERSESIVRRINRSAWLHGGLAAAARLVLTPDTARDFERWMAGAVEVPVETAYAVADSAGYRPSGTPAPPHSPGQVGHQLIITEHVGDPEAIGILLPRARTTTILATSDTFGRADFTRFLKWPGVDDVRVEHLRSRASRFSAEYIETHEATARLGRRLTTAIAADIGDLLDEVELGFLEVDLADFIFFQALKIEAVDLLAADDGFDDIVLAIDNDSHEFLDLMASTAAITDPRLTIVSVTRSSSRRAQFWSMVERLLHPVEPTHSNPVQTVPNAVVLEQFDKDTRRLADEIDISWEGGRPPVLLVTANNPAYNDSTAHFARELSHRFDVSILHHGRNATQLAEYTSKNGARPAIPIRFIAPPSYRLAPLAAMLDRCLGTVGPADPPEPGDLNALAAFHATRARLVGAVAASSIGRLRIQRHWLDAAVASRRAPDAIVITPNRHVGTSSICAAARRCQIPTIVLEPHAHDANYSRYMKIPADYYGVMSGHYRSQAATGLGIPLERTFSVGTPRLIAPPGHEPGNARRHARLAYSERTGYRWDDSLTYLTYFCQPSDWTQVATIWRTILDAAGRRSCVVLLKTHPEETISRVRQYRQVAESMGASSRVVLLDTDAEEAVDLADIVLTGYSAAALDAAIRLTPVICVADGDEPYPVDLPAIIGCDRAGSADELDRLLADIASDPDKITARAAQFLDRENQFRTGPGERVRDLIDLAIDRGAAGVRNGDELPSSLFLDQPHPIFKV